MSFAFRVDASTRMGIGHLRRCLALARALARLGGPSVFVMRDLGLAMPSVPDLAGARWLRLPAVDHAAETASGPAHAAWAGVDASTDVQQTLQALEGEALDGLVIDHYGFDARWHRAAATALAVPLCAIDDLGDRALDADLVVDHNLADDHRRKYAGSGSRVGRLLGGPRYALLDEVYRDAPRHRVADTVRSVGIFVGGTDPGNASAMALAACRREAGFDGEIEIATTGANPHLVALQAACAADPQARLLVDAPDLSDFYARHDIQIGAGGGAALERCCIGAPTLLMTLAENQRPGAERLAAAGVVLPVAEPTPVALAAAFAQLQADAGRRHALSEGGRALVDGQGARRVALALCLDRLQLRPARADDAALSHAWRNDAQTRRYSRDPAELALASHTRWWHAAVADPRRRLWLAQVGDDDLGVVRLDLDGQGAAEVSIYVDPGLTGIGLGPHMLQAAARQAQAEGLQRLDAEIDPENAASAAAFQRAGFGRAAPRLWVRRLAA